MRFEQSRRCTTSIGWTDPRKNDGELMFPERFSEKTVAELEQVLGSYATAGQLQQRPAPRGGGVIKIEWFRDYEDAIPPPLEFRFLTADTASTAKTNSDYTVFQAWARTKTGQLLLLDLWRGRWEIPEVMNNFRAFYVKHRDGYQCQFGSQLRGAYVENKSSGTGLIQSLRREGFAILPVERSVDKYSRASDAVPFIESGNVLLPRVAHWKQEFLAEVERFTGLKSGETDDQLEGLFDAVMMVQRMPATIPAQSQQRPMPMDFNTAYRHATSGQAQTIKRWK
jgi:predicted phage terminase large subunit-like protein